MAELNLKTEALKLIGIDPTDAIDASITMRTDDPYVNVTVTYRKPVFKKIKDKNNDSLNFTVER